MTKSNFNAGDIEKAAKVTYALNHKERLYILQLLERSIELRPMDIAKELKISSQTVQKHLTLLLAVGLIRYEVVTRKEVYYSIKEGKDIQFRIGIKILSLKSGKQFVEYVRFGTVA